VTQHPLQLEALYALAVGDAIARAFGADGQHSDTTADWIHYCVTAAEEAHAAVLDDPPQGRTSVGQDMCDAIDRDEIGFKPSAPPALVGAALMAAANNAAAVAFRCCLPQLTNRRRVQAYIACIAVGVGHHYIAAKDGNALLYPAQLALAAFPKRRANTPRKATNP